MIMWNLIKTKVHSSYFYLLIGFISLFFSNGRWTIPIAANFFSSVSQIP
jgi:hypothetical protein